MPDTREHRGPHPADAELFAPEALPRLRQAVADFSMLLTKGYADKSALKLVGDRFSLTQRQRLAVMRSSCSDQQLRRRTEHQVPIEALASQPLAIDGYNLLITIEAALSGGLIFRGRDGCCRDLASIHGTYRKVEETIPAIERIGDFLAEIRTPRGMGFQPMNHRQDADATGNHRQSPAPAKAGDAPATTTARVLWLLDSPVSNSGRLKTLLGDLARARDWPWEIRLTINPDAELSRTETTVVSTDSVILDACPLWANLAAGIIARALPAATMIRLCE
jgi:hypothetical protein